ncbi:MAG: hypothetical protein GC129_06880 [Proteobacteria bacterium]|nr:hypothetical protein [Pseudomonadota bacterium]
MANKQNSSGNKKPGFFKSMTGALDDVINEIKADVQSMTPPDAGKEDPRLAREKAEEAARIAALVNQSSMGLAVGGAEDEPYSEPPPEEDDRPQPAKPKALGLPSGNLWQALKNPELTTRFHADIAFHALTTGDLKQYYEAVASESKAPFTLGLLAINLSPLTAEELADPAYQPDSFSYLMSRVVQDEPRVFGAIGAGPRHLWDDLDVMDDYFTNFLNNNAKVIALGPVGLDEPFAPYSIAQQQAQLARQLEIAADFSLPVILTNRNSHAKLAEILAASSNLPPLVYYPPLVAEADLNLVKQFNMYAVLRPEITAPDFAGSPYYQAIPANRLLMASGSALVAPHGFAGHFNQPKYMATTLEAAAKMLSRKPAELQAQTNRNLTTLFPQIS